MASVQTRGDEAGTHGGAESVLGRREALQPPPELTISPRGYWLLALAIVGLYLMLWLVQFHYVYGWLNDDQYVFLKGQQTVQAWQNAFTYGHNALQPYFFLISYLPLWVGGALPSYPLPLMGAATGVFRFLLLYVVFLHAGLLLVWAGVAPTLSPSRLVALLSLLLLASSPTFALWTPQPESRLLGLPFALAGLWLLARAPQAGPRQMAALFLAGSLFGVAAQIHYTTLYLVGPVSAVWGGAWLWRRRRAAWRGLLSFALGSLWLWALLELVSHFVVGLPWDKGPTLALLKLHDIHDSPWPFIGSLGVWREALLSQMGPALLVVVAVGWVLYWRRGAWRRDGGATEAWCAALAVAVGVPLGLAYVVLSGSMPFFRQTSVVQPFLFLFASVALVAGARRVPGATAGRLAALVVGLLMLGAIPWAQTTTVFQAHQSLGRALDWAYTHHGDHPLAWLRVASHDGFTELDNVDDLAQAAPGTWLLSYWPFMLVRSNPSVESYFSATPPIAAWPSLYATDALRAEHMGYGYNDFRADSVLNTIRVTEVGALQGAMGGVPLTVAAVTADSTASADDEPGNVFDHDGASDGTTAWVSGEGAEPHWLEAYFAAPTPVGAMDVVLPTRRKDSNRVFVEQVASRIGDLEVQVADAQGTYRTVWRGRDLRREPVIAARWPATPTTAVRLVVRDTALPTGEPSPAVVEEVLFPGFQVVAPPLARPLPPPVLDRLAWIDRGLLVTGSSFTPHTRLVLDGARVAVRNDSGQQIVAPFTAALRQRAALREPLEAYVENEYGRSPTVRLAP